MITDFEQDPGKNSICFFWTTFHYIRGTFRGKSSADKYRRADLFATLQKKVWDQSRSLVAEAFTS